VNSSALPNEPPPSRPLLVFDGDCTFCRAWIGYWKRLTGDAIAYAPYQETAERFPQFPRESFARAVQLILPDGERFSAAHAVFRSLALVPGYAWLLWAYRRVPGFAAVAEWVYRQIAAHRSLGYRATVVLWGKEPEPATYEATVRWFFRALGLIYLIAFLSLEVQIAGLIGAHGILPAERFLAAVRANYGVSAWLRVPTLFLFGAGDTFLRLACVAGAIASVAVILGFARQAALATAFVLYLSLVHAGQSFLSFQWDFLLLESGFLAIFLKPALPRVWLFRWLLFRLMLLSGAAKLLSQDPTWRNLTALRYHFETQPLPTIFAWYFHQLPLDFQKLSCGFMFFVELVVPFLFFAPRRVRFFAAAMTITLQALIFMTGNYTFFNLLAVALCLLLLDDAAFRRGPPSHVRSRATTWRAVSIALSVFILCASGFQLLETFSGVVPAPAAAALSAIAPFGVVNTYGLFAVMTTSRPEIVVEGSNDGQTWREYNFRYKPGDLKRAPVWVQPYQPRLDWQMWFAALENYQADPWFVNFTVRLLEGSPDVLALLGRNPFPSGAPRYIRARLYEYRFTTADERRATGDWWKREPKGEYLPAVSLRAAPRVE
jgi:predicted DCC family thiol-disulfide oxidoreductase YuxK